MLTVTLTTRQPWKASRPVLRQLRSCRRHLPLPTSLRGHPPTPWTIWFPSSAAVEEGSWLLHLRLQLRLALAPLVTHLYRRSRRHQAIYPRPQHHNHSRSKTICLAYSRSLFPLIFISILLTHSLAECYSSIRLRDGCLWCKF